MPSLLSWTLENEACSASAFIRMKHFINFNENFSASQINIITVVQQAYKDITLAI